LLLMSKKRLDDRRSSFRSCRIRSALTIRLLSHAVASGVEPGGRTDGRAAVACTRRTIFSDGLAQKAVTIPSGHYTRPGFGLLVTIVERVSGMPRSLHDGTALQAPGDDTDELAR
jgi:hypothetical protein